MNFASRPCAALLLAFAAGGASANDSSPAQLAGFDLAHSGDWTLGSASTGLDDRAIDKGRSAGHSAYGIPSSRYSDPGARRSLAGAGYLDLGVRHDLDRAVSVMLHAGDGREAASAKGSWNWRDLRAGLNRKLDGGWLLALNYTSVVGASGVRGDQGPAFLGSRRKALVLSMKRKF